jgi:two-component system, sensor histidine kinase and response regulator
MNRKIISQYLIINTISAITVVGFAFIQYNFIQKEVFNASHYLIPLFVGLIFGTLFTRIKILVKHLAFEKEQVLDKNKKIHSFTGTIVHDLKSPLSAIHSLLDLFCEDCENLSQDQKEYLTMMKQSSSSMLENIALILDNTRLEAGIKPDHFEIGNPYYTIQSTIDKYLIEAINKSISIQRIIDKNLPRVAYDKNTLDRILSNLISNAIKYSPQNTQVKVYTELLADRLKLTVKDEGLGMSENDLKDVFQEFKRLSARPTGNEGSTGLGLSIAKKLVDQLGGEISAYSEGKDKGTAFDVTLKIAEIQLS